MSWSLIAEMAGHKKKAEFFFIPFAISVGKKIVRSSKRDMNVTELKSLEYGTLLISSNT